MLNYLYHHGRQLCGGFVEVVIVVVVVVYSATDSMTMIVLVYMFISDYLVNSVIFLERLNRRHAHV